MASKVQVTCQRYHTIDHGPTLVLTRLHGFEALRSGEVKVLKENGGRVGHHLVLLAHRLNGGPGSEAGIKLRHVTSILGVQHGHVRRGILFLVHFIPVDVVEEGVGLHLIRPSGAPQSPVHVLSEEPSNQVRGLRGHKGGNHVFAAQNSLFGLLFALIGAEWAPAGKEIKHENPKGPPVGRLSVSGILDHDFGGHVLDRPAEGGGEGRVVLENFTESKVDELDVSLGVEHDVFGLEVPVHDVEVVQVLQGAHDLAEVEQGELFQQHALRLHESEELSAAAELLDEVEPLLGLERVEHFDEERVLDQGQHVPFRSGVARIRAAVDDPGFVDGLEGVDGVSVHPGLLAHLVNFPVGPLAQHLEDLEGVDAHFLLSGSLGGVGQQ